MEKFDTIIIGSGAGGLSIGVLLSHRKPRDKVLVLEKNSGIGGRMWGGPGRDGFKSEIGCHMSSTTSRGTIGDILRIAGTEDQVQYTYARPMTMYKGKLFAFPRGLQGMVPERDFRQLTAMYQEMMSLHPSAVAELDEVDFCSYVHRFTDNQVLHSILAHLCHIFSVVSYAKTSTGEFLRFLQTEARSRATGYPIGGFVSIANAMAEGIRKAGGVIRTNAKVEKILIEGGVAKGVVAGGKTYLADTIISNADIKHTVRDLIGEQNLDQEYARHIRDLEFSLSVIILRLALDKKVVDWPYINWVGGDEPIDYHRKLEAGKVPNNLNLFMPCPSNLDPGMAPAGKQLINALVAGIPIDVQDVDGFKDAMLDTLQDFIPNLKKHLMWVEVTAPRDIDKFVGEQGAAIGVAQTVTQAGKNRPSIRTPIPNLYICGAETGGWGEGTELAVESARSLFMMLYR
ncbi:MAG: NAD(P)/FAD-dependent oxidoreductase [bacterium]